MERLCLMNEDEMNLNMQSKFFSSRGFDVFEVRVLHQDDFPSKILVLDGTSSPGVSLKDALLRFNLVLAIVKGEKERFRLVRATLRRKRTVAESDAKRDLLELCCDEVEKGESSSLWQILEDLYWTLFPKKE